jgi:hypothetical protein
VAALLINRKHLKLFALACCENRAYFRGKKVRVAASYYVKWDAMLKRAIVADIEAQPSKGVTLQ